MNDSHGSRAAPLKNSSSRVCTGKLKIFFGYAHGTGKTYAMLKAAHRARAKGIDVVAGCMGASRWPKTAALLNGLELLSPHRQPDGLPPEELALDEALTRRPQLLLLDELAHTNPPGSRHIKRYQDVAELLRAGIDVYATANVQDLEGMADAAGSVMGIDIAERVPDRVFNRAEQVEVVDIEPQELLARLREEDAWQGEQTGSPWTEKQLTSLRGMAFRCAADRVGLAQTGFAEGQNAAGEHILICLSSAPSNAKVIRVAARMAEAFQGEFTALYVEPAGAGAADRQDKSALRANLRLAEELGARINTVHGNDLAIQVAEYARAAGVSKIVLGRSGQKKGLWFWRKTLSEQLSQMLPDLDIHIIPDQGAPHKSPPFSRLWGQERFSAADAGKMLGILALCTGIGVLFIRLGLTTASVVMVYILGVLCVAMATSGRIYSLIASALSVLVFNFFFTSPYFTLLSDPSYIATFGVMFIVAFISSTLTTRTKQQAAQSAQKAYRTELLLTTSQKLQKAGGVTDIITVAATQLNKLLGRSVLFYPADGAALGPPLSFPFFQESSLEPYLSASEQAVAAWVFKNNQRAGATTDTLPGAKCLYLAVRGTGRVLAVAGIVIDGGQTPDTFEKNLMMAILDQCGLALEKEHIGRVKQKMEEAARQEALRANLLRTISHDLRTPLTSISGSAGILIENSAILDEAKKRQLYTSIYDDSMWLVNLVENLLSVSRMENGSIRINRQPELLDEVFQEALNHLDRNAQGHVITVSLKDDLLMADMDVRLIVQVIINLLNNAVKYTPAGSHIELSAQKEGDMVVVQVADDGPGVPDASKEKLFDMFYTANNDRGDGRRGLGLGLSLCKSIVAAHGGTISVQDNHPTGARFRFTLHASEVNTYE